MQFSSELNKASMRTVQNIIFRFLNVHLQASVHSQVKFKLIKMISDATIFKKPAINHL